MKEKQIDTGTKWTKGGQLKAENRPPIRTPDSDPELLTAWNIPKTFNLSSFSTHTA